MKHNFETIRDAARAALEQADGDWLKASDLLRKWIDKDPDLYEKLVTPLLDSAVYNAIKAIAHSDRERFKLKANAGVDNTRGLHSLAKQQELDWLGYRLRGGKKLGDATRDDLQIEIEDYTAKAETCAQKSRWFKKIARKMGKAVCVRTAMDSATVQKLFEDSQYV